MKFQATPTKSWSEAPWDSTKMTRKVTATKMWPKFDWCQQTLADKFYDVLWVVTALISDWWTIYGENFIDGPPFQVRPSHGIPAPWLAIGEGLLVFLSTRRTAWYMWGYATLNTWNQSDELRVQFSSWTWLCIPGHPRNCKPYFIHMLQVWVWHTMIIYCNRLTMSIPEEIARIQHQRPSTRQLPRRHPRDPRWRCLTWRRLEESEDLGVLPGPHDFYETSIS